MDTALVFRFEIESGWLGLSELLGDVSVESMKHVAGRYELRLVLPKHRALVLFMEYRGGAWKASTDVQDNSPILKIWTLVDGRLHVSI